MARAVTSPEIAYYRSPGKWSKLYVAVFTPPTVYTARVSETFSTTDQILEISYDTGSGTLADVLPDMELWVGSSAGMKDKGICRIRDKDADKFYISEISNISMTHGDYLTVVASFGVWARPVRISGAGTVYMDETSYTDQHSAWDPMPNMGPHKVVELTGSTVVVNFDGSGSFCPGSTITGYSWGCSTASASSNLTTSNPGFTFNTTGWHIVYLIITAANGKTFFGVRYVYVWNEAHPPIIAEITQAGQCSVDTGGWQIGLTLHQQAGISQTYDRALVILFTKDYYNGVQVNMGPVTGCENIKFIGWVSEETINVSSESGKVSFMAHGAAYWMGKVPSWPDGVELTSTANAWTNAAGLTVDLGVYHFLRWRTTVTRIMDVYLTGDNRLTQEVSSSAQNLWSQIQEMTWNQIYARPGVNALNQLYIQIHPCLIPVADRAFPTVMTLTKVDLADEYELERIIIPPVAAVDMSGIVVTSPNKGSALFALSPGHSLPHYGEWDIQSNLLLSSQDQVITLAGLYRSWRNSEYPNIHLTLVAPISFIDCFPNQRCFLTLTSSDNIRGIVFSGGIIPLEVSLQYDVDTGYLHTEATFEAENSESIAVKGDIPGSGDTSQPPQPSFPDIPLPGDITPGWPPTGDISRSVVIHDNNNGAHVGKGVIYTTNFDSTSPNWLTMNGGLTQPQYASINRIIVTPSGVLYAAYEGRWLRGHDDGHFLARAPKLGDPWTIILTEAMVESDYPGTSDCYIGALACRPDTPETVLYIAGQTLPPFGDTTDIGIYLGSGGSFSKVSTITDFRLSGMLATASFGQNTWAIIYNTVVGIYGSVKCHTYNSGATSQTNLSDIGTNTSDQIRAGITGTIFVTQDSLSSKFKMTTNNGVTWNALPDTNDMYAGGHGLAADDTGQYVMARWSSGARGKSSDGGTTWVGLPTLPVSTIYIWGYMGGLATASQWVVTGPADFVRYSGDFGNTWEERMGDLSTIGTGMLDIVVPIRTPTV